MQWILDSNSVVSKTDSVSYQVYVLWSYVNFLNLILLTSLIPGSGRPSGERIGYPLQYSQASLVAQLVRNPPAMRETWVRSLGWEEPLEKGTATHSSILAWRISWTEETGRLQSMGSQRVGHSWATFTFMLPLMFILGNYFKEVIPELVQRTAGFNQSGF